MTIVFMALYLYETICERERMVPVPFKKVMEKNVRKIILCERHQPCGQLFDIVKSIASTATSSANFAKYWRKLETVEQRYISTSKQRYIILYTEHRYILKPKYIRRNNKDMYILATCQDSPIKLNGEP